MQITINVEAKYLSAISEALAKYKGSAVTDQEVAEFIAMDLNERYEEIHSNNGFEDEIGMMEDFFI
jgi:hypothetical protein